LQEEPIHRGKKKINFRTLEEGSAGFIGCVRRWGKGLKADVRGEANGFFAGTVPLLFWVPRGGGGKEGRVDKVRGETEGTYAFRDRQQDLDLGSTAACATYFLRKLRVWGGDEFLFSGRGD